MKTGNGEQRMDAKGTRPQDLRIKNCRRLLRILSEEDSQTVNEIVAKMRLSRTAVQNILAKLTEDGMVIEREKRSSTRQGGKRAASYAISPDYKYSIFIYVSANNAIAELNNFALTRLEYRIADLSRLSYPEIVQQLGALIRMMLEEARVGMEELYGIAIAVSGMVDSDNGILLEFTGSDTCGKWGHNRPLSRDLCDCLGCDLDVYLDNMCNFSGYASYLAMAQGEDDSCVYVMAHSCGIGATYIKEGRVIKGSHGLLGEIGHTMVNFEGGYPCRCGRRGCFESMLYPESIRLRINRAVEQGLAAGLEADEICSVDDLLRAAQEGNACAVEQIRLIGQYFAGLFYNIQLMIDPDCIIFHDAFPIQLDMLHESMAAFGRQEEERHLKVPIKVLFDNSLFTEQVRKGAAYYLRNRFMNQVTEKHS